MSLWCLLKRIHLRPYRLQHRVLTKGDKQLKNLFVIFIAMVSLPLFAHEGHDHAHWSAAYLHLLFYGAIIAVVAAFSFSFYKRAKRNKS